MTLEKFKHYRWVPFFQFLIYFLLSQKFFNFYMPLQITRQGCGTTSNCFYGKACSSSVDCDYFVKFEYDSRSSSVHFAIGGKHDWIAFGLREGQVLSMVFAFFNLGQKSSDRLEYFRNWHRFTSPPPNSMLNEWYGIFTRSPNTDPGGVNCCCLAILCPILER